MYFQERNKKHSLKNFYLPFNTDNCKYFKIFKNTCSYFLIIIYIFRKEIKNIH